MMLLWAIFVPTPFLRTNKPSNTNIDLAKYEDDVKSYIDVYPDFINYGYDHARTAEGFSMRIGLVENPNGPLNCLCRML